MTTLTEEQKNEIAKELAAFFKTLHEIELSVSLEGLEVDKKTKAAYEYEVIQQAAYPLLKKSVQQEIDEVYKRILQQNFNEKKCLIHNDFGASNVYYDQKTNTICGLIDFGDIAIYDRELDFIEFYNQLENVYLGKEFEIEELFVESIAEIQNGLNGYEENILVDDKTIYYM